MNPSTNKTRYVIFDLDNCLSDDRERMKLIDWDAPNPTLKYHEYHQCCGEDKPGNLAVYRHWINDKGFSPIFMTARPETVRRQTERWMAENVLNVGEAPLLLMRSELDHSKSVDVKRKQLQELASLSIACEDIVIAFDDRPDIIEMYAVHGISGRTLKIHDVCAYNRPIDLSANIDNAKSETIRATAEEIRALEAFDRGSSAANLSRPSAAQNPITAADVLQGMTNTFRERQSVYKDNYKMVAKLMAVLFPDGVPPALVVEDQFHLFELMLVKLSRYAISNLTHIDSVHDLSVYGAMCEAINLNSERTK